MAMNVEVAQYEALAKELFRMCLAEDNPVSIREWIIKAVQQIGGGVGDDAIMTWPASFDLSDRLIDKYEAIANTPEKDRKILSWPWESWRRLIDPLDAGMLGVVTAPDGQGKTIYAESIAEHWAERRNRIVFVHFELNRDLMMLRRMARHGSVTPREIKTGRLTPEQKASLKEIRPRLIEWDGYINYLHTPGWAMDRTIAELYKLLDRGECDGVVLDYLEKASASKDQIKLYGSNAFQREADNVEQLKNFSEKTDVPVLMIAQMSKAGKEEKFEKLDRTGMRGAGEKSDKANLVVLLKRTRTDDGYSNVVDVLVDKNTMGSTGQFRQIMQPEYYRVGDIADISPAALQTKAQNAQRPGVNNAR